MSNVRKGHFHPHHKQTIKYTYIRKTTTTTTTERVELH